MFFPYMGRQMRFHLQLILKLCFTCGMADRKLFFHWWGCLWLSNENIGSERMGWSAKEPDGAIQNQWVESLTAPTLHGSQTLLGFLFIHLTYTHWAFYAGTLPQPGIYITLNKRDQISAEMNMQSYTQTISGAGWGFKAPTVRQFDRKERQGGTTPSARVVKAASERGQRS